ncbi:MAG: DUF3048 domain-containing protein [Ilumatobacteraceae bacterium]|nr:DUF3048 domain-containing protein [Ilumatobacteraceae bacterium]
MSKKSKIFQPIAACALLSFMLVACGGGGGSSSSDSDSTTTESAPASETIAPTPTLPLNEAIYPLTGLPRPEMDISVLTRPALVAKIDNHPLARPSTGLNKADIVFEENVEGLTRFAAVFHSQGSDPVGPLRSGRTQDVDILSAYNKPLFVWSGGNGGVTQAINKSALVNVGYLTSIGQGKYFRDKAYKAPHNLYSKTSVIWKLAPKTAAAPPQQFLYRTTSDATPATSLPAIGVKVKMDSVKVFWQWDSATATYLRNTENRKLLLDKEKDRDGKYLSATNVVVLVVKYLRSKADPRSPEAQTIGTGNAMVFTNGEVIRGTWARSERTRSFVLTDTAGAVIKLTPGRTWVELARWKTTSIVPFGSDPAKVLWR